MSLTHTCLSVSSPHTDGQSFSCGAFLMTDAAQSASDRSGSFYSPDSAPPKLLYTCDKMISVYGKYFAKCNTRGHMKSGQVSPVQSVRFYFCDHHKTPQNWGFFFIKVCMTYAHQRQHTLWAPLHLEFSQYHEILQSLIKLDITLFLISVKWFWSKTLAWKRAHSGKKC